jgi:hypothetical protein
MNALVLIAVVQTGIGAFIAVSKERSVWLGVALGFFLGFIGWIILAVLPRRTAY